MTNRDKIEIYKELQKELEDRKKRQIIFQQDFISIEADSINDWIYAEWKGYQTEASVKEGCMQILDAAKKFNFNKILNDNSSVIGIWTPAAHWVATEWFPEVTEAGIKKFAWTYSPAALSQFSTNETIKDVPDASFIKTFYSVEVAMAWLRGEPYQP